MEPQTQPAPGTFEQALARGLFSTQSAEKSYTDKLLARKDVSAIQEIVKKDDLTRSELLELLYLLSSSEIKLANFGDWDRYLLGKFLAWIRDFVSMAEILYDYKEKYKNSKNERLKSLMENNRKFMLHNIKFLVDIFLYLSRSTLSLSMSAFEILSTSRYEYAYPNMDSMAPRAETARSPFGRIKLGS
jgi:hypothetical protein